MKSLYRAASVAAFVVLAGMLIHNLNALYLEPTFLGFEDPSKDYADMAKIENAIGSFSFTSSGNAHMVVGLSLMLIAVAALEVFRESNPAMSRIAFVAAVVSGIGFLLTGISDIPGTAYAGLLRAENPDYNVTIILITTMIRGVTNMLAITMLGILAGSVSWCALKSGKFSKWGAYYGLILLIPGIGGLLNPILGFMYLSLVPIWAIWLGLQFRAQAAEAG